MELKDKQKRFVEEYLIDLNATQAAIRAGYSEKTAYSQGQRLLKNVEVKKYIEECQKLRNERTRVSQDDVINDLRELADICLGRKAVPVTEVIKNQQEGTVSCVTEEIRVFEPAGANRALELLAKHMGLFEKDNKTDISIDISGVLDSLAAVTMESRSRSAELREKIKNRKQTIEE